MKKFVLLVSLCGIALMFGAFKCGSAVTAIEFASSERTERTAMQHNSISESVQSKDPMELLDTASWEGYEQPKTVEVNGLIGVKLQGLDFVLDKHLRNMYGYAIINPERTRYGLYEFDYVEHMRLNKNDTLYAIIAAPGYQYNEWISRAYMFWTKNDTVAKDSPIDNYPIRLGTDVKRRLNTKKRLLYSVGHLKECLSTRLHGADSLDFLPPRYWAPIEDVEGDPNHYITFAIKMIFKDGVITQAWVTKFYNGAINQFARY